MKGSTGVLLIAIGLIALYIVLSDRYACFVQFIDCLTGNDYNTPEGYTRSIHPATTVPPSIVGPTRNGATGGASIWDLLRGVAR